MDVDCVPIAGDSFTFVVFVSCVFKIVFKYLVSLSNATLTKRCATAV